jgi:hypothetical protein
VLLGKEVRGGESIAQCETIERSHAHRVAFEAVQKFDREFGPYRSATCRCRKKPHRESERPKQLSVPITEALSCRMSNENPKTPSLPSWRTTYLRTGAQRLLARGTFGCAPQVVDNFIDWMKQERNRLDQLLSWNWKTQPANQDTAFETPAGNPSRYSYEVGAILGGISPMEIAFFTYLVGRIRRRVWIKRTPAGFSVGHLALAYVHRRTVKNRLDPRFIGLRNADGKESPAAADSLGVDLRILLADACFCQSS